MLGVKLAEDGCTGVRAPIVISHEPISQIDDMTISPRGRTSGGLVCDMQIVYGEWHYYRWKLPSCSVRSRLSMPFMSGKKDSTFSSTLLILPFAMAMPTSAEVKLLLTDCSS